jgi:hypothetical protein
VHRLDELFLLEKYAAAMAKFINVVSDEICCTSSENFPFGALKCNINLFKAIVSETSETWYLLVLVYQITACISIEVAHGDHPAKT